MTAIPPHIDERLDLFTRNAVHAWLIQIRICPDCGGKLTTRDSEKSDGMKIRRLRCKSCKKSIITYEEIKDAKLSDQG